jgi:polyisoprenoid-binding protein YceI
MKTVFLLLFGLVPAVLGATPASLLVDPAQSHIEIVVPCTMDSFTGKLDAYVATITVDDGRVTAAKLSFNFTDVHTGKTARDEAMHDWQATPKHPTCSFVMRTLVPIAGSGSRFNATGTLTLHDVACELTFPVSVTTEQNRYAIDGEAPLDTRNFGLPVIRKFGLLKVDPQIKVRFHLQGAIKLPAVTAAAAVAP